MRQFLKTGLGLIAKRDGRFYTRFVDNTVPTTPGIGASPSSPYNTTPPECCCSTFFIRMIGASKDNIGPNDTCYTKIYGLRASLCEGTLIYVRVVVPTGGTPTSIDLAVALTDSGGWIEVYADSVTKVWLWVEKHDAGTMEHDTGSFPGDISWTGVESLVAAWTSPCASCADWVQSGALPGAHSCKTIFSDFNLDMVDPQIVLASEGKGLVGRTISRFVGVGTSPQIAFPEPYFWTVDYLSQPSDVVAGVAMSTFSVRFVDRFGALASLAQTHDGAEYGILPTSIRLEGVLDTGHGWDPSAATNPLDTAKISQLGGTYVGVRTSLFTFEFSDLKIYKAGTYRLMIRPGGSSGTDVTGITGRAGNWAFSNPFTVSPADPANMRALDFLQDDLAVKSTLRMRKVHPSTGYAPGYGAPNPYLYKTGSVRVEVLDNPGRNFHNRATTYVGTLSLELDGSSVIPLEIIGTNSAGIDIEGIATFPFLRIKALGYGLSFKPAGSGLTHLNSVSFTPLVYPRFIEYPTAPIFLGQAFNLRLQLSQAGPLPDEAPEQLEETPSPLDNVYTFLQTVGVYSEDFVEYTPDPVTLIVLISNARISTLGFHRIGAQSNFSNYDSFTGLTPLIEVMEPPLTGGIVVEKLGGLDVRTMFFVNGGGGPGAWTINWGDTPDIFPGSGSFTGTHTYATSGTFTVSAELYSANGQFVGYFQEEVTVP